MSACNSHVGGEDAVQQLELRQVKGSLQLVVVEGDFSGSRAVQSSLHEGRPRVLQQEASANIVLTNSSSAGKHRPAAVVLHRVLTEEEVREVADIVGGHEVRFCGGKENIKSKFKCKIIIVF